MRDGSLKCCHVSTFGRYWILPNAIREKWLLCQFSVWYIILLNISILRMCNCVLKLNVKMCFTESNSLFNDRNVCFWNVVCTFVDKHIHINTRLQIISLKFFKHQKTFKFLVNLSCVFVCFFFHFNNIKVMMQSWTPPSDENISSFVCTRNAYSGEAIGG